MKLVAVFQWSEDSIKIKKLSEKSHGGEEQRQQILIL
jgi:hypothetical protein